MKKQKPTTKLCKYCKTEIPYDANVCPQCRKKQKGHGLLIGLAIVIAIGLLASCFGSADSKPVESPSGTEASRVAEATTQTPETTATVAKETTTAVPETTEPKDNVPTEYKSALKKAEIYSETMSMSKAGIYNQLTSEYGEKFSSEAAQYALDNMEADWNKNALAKAKTYSDTMYMSKKGIYDQLISEYGEQFTPEEAQYAVDNLEADWNENALKKAKSYQDTMAMSPSAIHDQLTSEYGEQFTKEEADYAIEHLE